MTRKELIHLIKSRKTFLCVGLDPDPSKMPKHILRGADSLFEFNRQIIDATREYCVAYKPNTAFYECFGAEGWEALRKTREYIGSSHFTIADAKRGDIGNTSKKYAQTFFDTLEFDAVTVAPYMGCDSVLPFLEYDGKWVIVLGLTSNRGADDFQFFRSSNSEYLFEKVLREASGWGNPENTMFVVGATRAELLTNVRELVPDSFLLIPGVGAQGGSLEDVVRFGKNRDVGLLVNVGRTILYADSGENFAEASAKEAEKIASRMRSLLD
jgi:orotidine-5'-phosphate decarboxylase